MDKNKEEVKFQLHKELGGLEMVDAAFHNKNFSKHSHEAYTINVIEKGTQKFFSSGKNYLAPLNSIILVNSDHIHTGQSALQTGWSYRGISPSPSQFSRLATDLGYSSGFIPYFPESVLHDHKMANELRQLFNLLSGSNNMLLRETLLYSVLTKLMLKYGRCKAKIIDDTNSDKALEWIREFIHANLDQNISLEQLSELSGISPFYLVRRFQKCFGLPPHAYQIQQRLQKSKSLLREGKSVATVAAELGFHDQSHFHRHFVRANGFPPGYYAAQSSQSLYIP